MLRTGEYHQWAGVRRQDHRQETDDEAGPERQDDPGDHDTQVTITQEHCPVLQLLRRSAECLHHPGAVQETLHDGAAQAPKDHHGL